MVTRTTPSIASGHDTDPEQLHSAANRRTPGFAGVHTCVGPTCAKSVNPTPAVCAGSLAARRAPPRHAPTNRKVMPSPTRATTFTGAAVYVPESSTDGCPATETETVGGVVHVPALLEDPQAPRVATLATVTAKKVRRKRIRPSRSLCVITVPFQAFDFARARPDLRAVASSVGIRSMEAPCS